MGFKCPKCESEIITLERDSRGLPEAHCAECGANIKKMSTGEVIEYFEQKIEQLDEVIASYAEERKTQSEHRDVCKWCNEKYFSRRGRLGTVYYPVEAVYCPMCGRKKQPDDMKY